MSEQTASATASREIAMPRLSDTMEEGTILRWLVDDGATVARGEELVEIETDKASMTYESDLDGVVQILVAAGETVAVGVPIARVGAPGEAPPVHREPAEPAATNEPVATDEQTAVGEPAATAPSAPEAPREAQLSPSGPPSGAPQPGGTVAAQSQSQSQSPGPPSSNGGAPQRVRATPLARRAAAVHGVALDALAGTGPRGRVLHADVLLAAGVERPAPRTAPVARPSRPPAVERPAGAVPVDTARGESRRIEPTRAQQLVARRMAEAKATIPEFQVQTDVAMDAAIAFRGELRAVLDDGTPSLNDLVVKACAIALCWHPRVNGSFIDGGFVEHGRVNVGVAVAGEQTLVVPVVHDADAKALRQIARETRALAERVRLGTVTPPELAGGTFTVSNLGMYGMTQIVPVINPPQAAILGVGAIRETLARAGGADAGTPNAGWQAGEIVERRLMTLTLSCDHRILYGADASLFLADVRRLLEAPLRLAL
jgi:pyruvate dehydrogenase E2 component (dihydrolipoamide acetyltransferase)